MSTFLPISSLKDTKQISDIVHAKQEPIFITKNDRIDMVIMSSELYEKWACINGIPFEYPNDETIAAIEEVNKLKDDPKTKTYDSFSELLKDLNT